MSLGNNDDRFRKYASVSAILFLIVSLMVAVGLSGRKQDIRKRAADISVSPTPASFITKKSHPLLINDYMPDQKMIYPADSDYAPRQIIVKFSQPVSPRTKTGISLNADGGAFTYSDLDPQSLPPVLSAINQKYGISRIEKIFKGTSLPTTQLSIIRQKFSGEITSGQRTIDENALLSNDLSRTYKIQIANSDNLDGILNQIAGDPGVEQAEPNFLLFTAYTPNDPMYSQQWPHPKTQANLAWDITKGNPSVKIAIVDTGVDVNHEDLKANIGDCTNGCGAGLGYDFVDIITQDYVDSGYSLVTGEDYTVPDNMPSDFNGHGTHCAGIAAGVGNNNLGISGVCPMCAIMPVRVGFSIVYQGDTYGALEDDDVALGIKYAADNGAKVISMSFGGYTDTFLLRDAINYANSLGVVLVGAAGNDSVNYPLYPAAYGNVIAVSATDSQDNRASFSNYGSWVDIAAPGVSILSTVPKTGTNSNPTGYLKLSGTSMATPFAAGVAGLILAKNPTFNPQQITKVLVQESDSPNEQVNYIGMGRINADKPLLVNTVSSSIASINSPSESQIVTRTTDIIGSATGTSYTLENGLGLYPGTWTQIGNGLPVVNNVLGRMDISSLLEDRYTLRLKTTDANGISLDRRSVYIGKNFEEGWPVSFGGPQPITIDVNNDGYPEIVAVHGNTLGIFSYKGVLLKSFTLDGSPWIGPSSADINRDGKPEIAVSTLLTGSGHMGSLYVFNADGLVWKKSLEPEWHLCTVIEDVNKDDYPEIIVQTYNSKLFVVDYQGNLLPGWPQPFKDYDMYSNDCPAAADIDQDGYKEIIAGKSIDAGFNPGDIWRKYNGSISVYRFDGTLEWEKTLVQESPETKYFSRAVHSSPVVGDINNDRKREIVFAQDAFNASSSTDRIYRNRFTVLDETGGILPGWPQDTDSIGDLTEGPVLADLDGDKKLEIIGHGKSSLYVWRSDGTLYFPPVELNADPRFKESSIGNPVVAEVTGDGKPDIIVYSHKNCRYYGCLPEPKLFIISNNGSVYGTNWPKNVYNYAFSSSPAVADIDKDSRPEIIFQGMGYLFAWDNNLNSANVAPEWSSFRHDSQHTGFYPPIPTPTISLTPSPSPYCGWCGGNCILKTDNTNCLSVIAPTGTICTKLTGASEPKIPVCITIVPTNTQAQNLVVNGSFETWSSALPSGWKSNAAVTPPPYGKATGYAGAAALEVKSAGRWLISDTKFPVSPATTYELSVYARDASSTGPQSTNAIMGMTVYDAASSSIPLKTGGTNCGTFSSGFNGYYSYIASTNTWKRFTFRCTTPTTPSNLLMEVRIGRWFPSTDIQQFDDLRLTKITAFQTLPTKTTYPGTY